LYGLTAGEAELRLPELDEPGVACTEQEQQDAFIGDEVWDAASEDCLGTDVAACEREIQCLACGTFEAPLDRDAYICLDAPGNHI
jgi:hypothetical protein